MKQIRLILQSLMFLTMTRAWGYAQEDIRDVVGPQHYPTNPIVWIVIAVLLLAILTMVAIKIFNSRKKLKPEEPQDLRTPWEKAIDELNILIGRKLIEEGRFEEFYVGLSFIVRKYVEERFNIRAPEMTTEEFLNFIKKSDILNIDQKDALKQFLEFCDMVKFAKYLPSIDEARNGYDLAVRLVEQTKQEKPTL